MAMFKDKDRELERLQAQLLAEEEALPAEEDCDDDDSADWEESEDWEAEDDWEAEEADMDATRVYPNFSNDYGRIYNNDTADADMESYSDQVYSGKKQPGTLGLCIIALCLVAAILGVLAWWIIRFR